MNRVVFSVTGLTTAGGASGLGIQLREPRGFGRQTVELTLAPTAQEFQALAASQALEKDAVRRAGRALYDALVANNPDLRKHIEAALLVQPPERFPVFVELDTGDGEPYPWETLCSPDGDFLGLDERWAIGRLVECRSQLPATWVFEPPVRIAAILSCLDVKGESEWNSLRAACEAAQVPVELLALVGEDELHSTIGAAGLDWVTVEFLPSTVEGIASRLQQFHAHVLHMFCHGLSTSQSPHLQVATRERWLSPEGKTLLIEAKEINTFNPPVDNLPWLVVLNSCETAAASGQETPRSLALDLIATYGVPAVVGMREPVSERDAPLFSRAFYDQLMSEFSRLLQPGQGEEPIEWARLMVGVREQIAEQYEQLNAERGTQKQWTLPVVYSRPDGFRLQVLAPAGPAPVPPVPPAPPATDGRLRPAGPEDPPAEGAAAPPESAAEPVRRIVLSIRVLTGLRAQVEASGDPAMLAMIDEELATLQAELEGRSTP